MSGDISQPGLPRGLGGHIVGWIMAWHNRLDNEWTINQLEVDDNDRLFEVGFGPGRAIRYLSDANPSSRITGVDYSKTMLKSATRLNKRAIAAGRVSLELGSVEHLPFADCTFDKAFSINCIYFWKGPIQGLRELHRILKSTGCVAITVRDKEKDAYQAFRPVTVEFTVMGIPCLGLNGGPNFKHSEAFSFQVATADQAETDRYWNAIVGNGGEESACGWCKDKWGLSWQITPTVLTEAFTGPDRAAAKRAFDVMMQMGKNRRRRHRSGVARLRIERCTGL